MKTVNLFDYVPQFINAETYLWKLYGEPSTTAAMDRNWLTEWNIKFDRSGHPFDTKLIFPNDAAFTFWLLRWT